MDIIYDISVRELIESEDESLQLLIQDINILLKNPEDIKNNMNWKLENKLFDWESIKVENGRIIHLEFSTFGIDIKDEDIKRLILPHNLKKLCFTRSYIGYDGIKGLVEIIPSELEELWFYSCENIDIKCLKVLKLPLKLKRLFFTNNNIDEENIKELCKILPPGLQKLNLAWNNINDEGVKGLVFPPGLQELALNNNNIGNEGAKRLVLPISLQKLFIYSNNIGPDGAKRLILPPGLKELDIRFNKIDDSTELVLPPVFEKIFITHYTNYDKFIQKANSPEGIRKYAPIKRYYDFKKCKPIWKEICRGLIYGETEDSIFRFLQKIHGSKNIRQNILTFYNPFV